jgi:pimeloyl-ACP methyl ester carboxylesterase
MAQYPGANPTFTTKTDAVDDVQAAHINAVQDEIAAIGAALRGTLTHDVTTSKHVVAGDQVKATNQYRALLYHNAAQTLATGTWTALLFGAEDTSSPRSEGELIKQHVPQARLQVIPQAGHLAVFEQPESAHELMRKFLDEQRNG